MFQPLIKCAKRLGFLVLVIASSNQAFSQQTSVALLGKPDVSGRAGNGTKSESKSPVTSASILASVVAAENKVRQALNQHTFKRDVVLQTIGPNGDVTGEYIRNSQFLFDDHGRRIERVIFHPASTIREMRITKEDIQDLAGAQLLGIDIVEATKYNLTYAGTEMVDARQLFAVDVTPLIAPDPHHMAERFFVGRVWVDPTNLQIVKIKGVVEPQGKQRFPMFQTWREPINNAPAFPTRTEADDVLHFPGRDVHYRIRVRYYDYQLFGSKVSIKEIDEPVPDSDEALPKTNVAPSKANEALPKKKEASPKLKDAPAKITASSSIQPTVPTVDSRKKAETCTINRNAPPAGEYHWPVDSEVKVYFGRAMFTPDQSAVLIEAMKTWTALNQEFGSGVKFIYAGETENRMTCESCLTVTRRAVLASDKHHYAFFNPMKEHEGLLVSAWIDLDFGIKDPRALQGFMAHELGHGLGLWDCPSCKKKRSLMSSFPGVNKNNGLIAPSSCDLATMQSVYREERQLASTRPSVDKQAEAVRALPLPGVEKGSPSVSDLLVLAAASTAKPSEPPRAEGTSAPLAVGLQNPGLAMLDLHRFLVGGAAANKSLDHKRPETVRAQNGLALPPLGLDRPGFSVFNLQRPNVERFVISRGGPF
jgi:hypothetical protein